MNKFLHHLKSKGYEINGNTAMLLGVKFKICNGTIKTARGLKTHIGQNWHEMMILRSRKGFLC